MRRYFLILFRLKNRPFDAAFIERWSINIVDGAFSACAINNRVSDINSTYDSDIDIMEVLNIMEIPESVYSDLDEAIEYRYITVSQDEIEE